METTVDLSFFAWVLMDFSFEGASLRFSGSGAFFGLFCVFAVFVGLTAFGAATTGLTVAGGVTGRTGEGVSVFDSDPALESEDLS